MEPLAVVDLVDEVLLIDFETLLGLLGPHTMHEFWNAELPRRGAMLYSLFDFVRKTGTGVSIFAL
jgi:hypothetical protein